MICEIFEVLEKNFTLTAIYGQNEGIDFLLFIVILILYELKDFHLLIGHLLFCAGVSNCH